MNLLWFRRKISSIVSTLPLDCYPGAAGAYSTRLIRGNYSGPLIKVKRLSDFQELDFYQGANPGELDSVNGGGGVELVNWVGAGNSATIVTWYDQSTNAKHVSQVIITKQPYIVISGTLVTINSKPAIRFVKSNSQVLTGSLLSNSSEYSVYSIFKFASTGNQFSPVLQNGDAGVGGWLVYTEPQGANPSKYVVASLGISGTTTSEISTNAQLITINRYTGNNLIFQANNVNQYVGSTAALTVISGSFRIGGSDFGEFYGGDMNEVIIYPSNTQSNNSPINTLINSYYGIF